MKKLYTAGCLLLCTHFILPFQSSAQNCSLLQARCRAYESRCASTGSIKVLATGGSGNYKYKTIGPVNTNFTSIDSITGLSAGVYTVVVTDINTSCSISVSNVVIPGTYQDPRFSLRKTDVSCDNGNNGRIWADSIQFGRGPYSFRIIAPSPMGVGTTNPTGVFTQLIAGEYSIQMIDSCGGIQTRRITLNNYTWRIDAYPFTQTSCNNARGFIRVIDSRGNISTSGGIPGFMYGIVRVPGDTIWSASPNFSFSLNGNSSFQVIAKDACGIIKTGSTSVSFNPSINSTVTLSGYQCNSFNASVTGSNNLFNPTYCLFDNLGNQISCNSTGSFSSLPYGSYCIQLRDACTDTTITRCFTATPPSISVGNQVVISQKTCTSFTASISQATGLTNPQFCLLDTAGNEISCNGTGVFTNLAYGNYCIRTKDGCRDTSILRCFSAAPPTPSIHPLAPAYMQCANFGVVVQGDSLSNPYYCLIDSSGNTISCNNTGVFDSIPYGNYCVQVYDSCYNITMTQCISLPGPTITNDLAVHIDYIRCQSFNVTVNSQYNINNYCLYDVAGNEVACDSNGVFNNLPSGTYCVHAHSSCPDTTLTSCFRLAGPIPSVGSSLSYSNVTCNSFSASVTRQDNLVNPRFCLYDNRDSLISCNSTGNFSDLAFGSYCIRITTDCYDTTITRCFSKWPVPVDINIQSNKSCSYGFASFNISLTGAVLPAIISIFNPDGSLFTSRSSARSSLTIDSLPGTVSGQRYKIVVTDQCGNRDSAMSGASSSYFTHAATVTAKCPSGTWSAGSGNIKATATTNKGRISVRIIKKNGTNYSPFLSPNVVSGNDHTFNDLGPGTYIIRYTENDCNKYLYDTVVIKTYQFPNLDRSTAYQCDLNGFSVSAVASNGVAPFQYEIIGSSPSIPSIVTGTQSSPIFNINNGNTYSLIRLRAIDACGNATLGDASILPLANNGIMVSNNCFQNPTTLSVDSIFGATYTWYKKDSLNATDSTLVSSTSTTFIPILSAADTGIYICHLVVNNGCIKRTYRFNLNGLCYQVLPENNITLKGRSEANRNILYWESPVTANAVIERKTEDGIQTDIGDKLMPVAGQYNFTDHAPKPGINMYRLKIVEAGSALSYSNWVSLNDQTKTQTVEIYPNPVSDRFTIRLPDNKSRQIIVSIWSLSQQNMYRVQYEQVRNGIIEIARPVALQGGLYILQITDPATGLSSSQKILFR